MNPIKDIRHFIMYGRVIHRSSNGNVIRKKVKELHSPKEGDRFYRTTKTVINKKGEVEKKLYRRVISNSSKFATTTKTEVYDTSTGCLKVKNPPSTDFFVHSDEKRIVDYRKTWGGRNPNDSLDEYLSSEMVYPEVTVIRDGKVIKTKNKRSYVR